MNTQLKIVWLAGLLEGEGYFGLDHRSPCIHLQMVDEDVIRRAVDFIEELTGKRPNIGTHEKKGAQIIYRIALTGESARILMLLIVKHMGYRRRKRIWQTLNGVRELKIDLVSMLNILPFDKKSA